MYQSFPTLNNKFPCEGPRVVPCILDFSIAPQYDVDLKTLVQRGQISEIQSLYIDNSKNAAALTIVISVQNQSIIIPAYSQAYLGILASSAEFTVIGGSTATVTIFAQNFPVSNCVWSTNATGQVVSVSNFPTVQAVSVSNGTSLAFQPAGTGATAGVGANLAVTTTSASVSIVPTNGQNIRLFNNGSAPINVRLTAGASTATTSDLTIAPNTAIILNASNMTTLSAICATGTSTLNYTIGNGGI